MVIGNIGMLFMLVCYCWLFGRLKCSVRLWIGMLLFGVYGLLLGIVKWFIIGVWLVVNIEVVEYVLVLLLFLK